MYLLILLVVLSSVFIFNILWIKRVVNPIIEEFGDNKPVVRSTRLSFYYDNDVIYKTLLKLSKRGEPDKRDKFRYIFRMYVALQVSILILFILLNILMINMREA